MAFVVSAAVGLDVSCEAVPYIASFGGDDPLEALERSAQAIDTIARRIEDALELRNTGETPEAAYYDPSQTECSTRSDGGGGSSETR